MDEFARMMSMEGVRPLDRVEPQSRRSAKRSSPRSEETTEASAELEQVGHAWVGGLRARTALETAIERLIVEIRSGRRGWATGLRQDGKTVTLATSSSAAALLGAADRQALRLIVVGGDGWTFVMHPLMGVATLDEDPVISE